MKRTVLGYSVVLCLVGVLCLAGVLLLAGCDSDGDGKGGSAAQGYSLADLAGVWSMTTDISGAPYYYGPAFKLEISTDGKVISFKGKGGSPCGAAVYTGVFSVSPEGIVTATGLLRCQAFWAKQWLQRKFEMTFTSANMLTGTLYNLGWWTEGVGWQTPFTPTKAPVSMQKQ